MAPPNKKLARLLILARLWRLLVANVGYGCAVTDAGDAEYFPHWGFRSPQNRSMKSADAASGVG